MIDGFDTHKDAMGLVPSEEFLCGKCRKAMAEIAPNKYRCPKCGAEFENDRRKMR